MRISILIALFLCGCTTLQSPEAPDTLPQLIYQAPLPTWPTSTTMPGMTLDLLLRVGEDGSVLKARLLTPSGNSSWDSLALATIGQWRFSPARSGNTAVPVWIQQKVRVQFEPPSPMILCELGLQDRVMVDSLYAMLQEGVPFDSLARRYSVLATRKDGGYLGLIDTRVFPSSIRRQLAELRPGEMTRPLVLGENLVIFKRLAKIR